MIPSVRGARFSLLLIPARAEGRIESAGALRIRARLKVRLAIYWRVQYLAGMNERIMIDPAVCNGRPCIRGTRIAAQTVLEFLGAGDSVEDVLAEYPALTREDILACMSFSSELMGNHFTVLKVA